MKTVIVSCIAIVGIIIIECVALSNKINGVMLMSSLSIIAGLGGYYVKETQEAIKNIKENLNS